MPLPMAILVNATENMLYWLLAIAMPVNTMKDKDILQSSMSFFTVIFSINNIHAGSADIRRWMTEL